MEKNCKTAGDKLHVYFSCCITWTVKYRHSYKEGLLTTETWNRIRQSCSLLLAKKVFLFTNQLQHKSTDRWSEKRVILNNVMFCLTFTWMLSWRPPEHYFKSIWLPNGTSPPPEGWNSPPDPKMCSEAAWEIPQNHNRFRGVYGPGYSFKILCSSPVTKKVKMLKRRNRLESKQNKS